MSTQTFDATVETDSTEESVETPNDTNVLAVAAEGLREGAGDARAAAARLIPAVKQAVSKGVYRTFYGISYGAVYSAMVVANVIPTNNAMGEGLKRGAESAKEAFRKQHTEQTTAEEATIIDHLDDAAIAV
jgi:hypothetical protein